MDGAVRQSGRRILLADADAFYVAVARLVDPDGAGRAPCLIVGGSADHRGVVTSASYEARRFGVHSAMPMGRAMRLCPKAMVVPVPWEACTAKSRHIRDVLGRFTPVVEQASSDEFYLDLSGTERLYGGEPLAATATRIREAVLAETALSVTIGGGTSRFVAKLATNVAKPGTGRPATAGGVLIIPSGGEGEFLRRFTLADLPLVGPKFQERLQRLGLRTVDDVLRYDRATLVAWLGQREADWLYERVRGVDDGDVVADREPKSISRDETFAVDSGDDVELERRLLELTDRASADLREAGLLARTVTVKIRDADFTTRQAGRTPPEPVCSDRAIYALARELLHRLRRARRVPARLLGVALSQFVRADAAAPQLSLLEAPAQGAAGVESDRDRVLARVLDEVRERFGPDALARGRTPGA